MHKSILLFLSLALHLLSGASASAELMVPAIFSDHMVLQREMPVPVWGKAAPGEKVTVTFKGQAVTADAGKDGRWMATLQAMRADANPAKMEIVSASGKLTLTNILVGEVWLCSGQSNMQLRFLDLKEVPKNVREEIYPDIRLFYVAMKGSGYPQDQLEYKWCVCDPTAPPVASPLVVNHSVVGYYFIRELFKELKVPVGLIQSAHGGSGIEAWTPALGFQDSPNPELNKRVSEIKKAHEEYRDKVKAYLEAFQTWFDSPDLSAGFAASIPVHPLASYQRVTGLYNGMIAPVVRYAIRGVIWYQGESNTNDGLLYADMMKAMVDGWRKIWSEGDFPFYFVQIAPYKGYPRLPELWTAQYQAAKEIKNCGMVSAVDVTDIDDCHPQNKEPVGRRLARMALKKTYGRTDIQCESPGYRSMEITGDKIRVSFDNVSEGGLCSRDGKPPNWFEIAAQDGAFKKAEAVIDGKTVIVSSPLVPKPASVRFAWNYIAEPNLSDKDGLPVLPFDEGGNH